MSEKDRKRGSQFLFWIYLLVGITITGLLVVNIVLNLFWFRPFATELESKLIELNLSDAKRKSEIVEKDLVSVIKGIEDTAEKIALIGIDEPISKVLIERSLGPNIREISIIGLDGSEVERYSRGYIDDLRDFSSQDDFKEALSEPYISPPTFTEYGEPYLIVSTPIRARSTARTEAVLRNEVYLGGMWEDIVSKKPGESGRVAVIDGKGSLIANTDPSLVLQKVNLLSLPPSIPLIEGKIFEGERYLNSDGDEVVGVGTPIASLGWGLIVEQDVSEIEVLTGEVRFFVNLFLILGATVIGLLAFLALTLRKGSKRLLEKEKILEVKNKALASTKEWLESEVKVRTTELKEMNDELEEKVRERTEEMQKKLEEFEKVSKLMTGRELRMIELKKELKVAHDEIETLKGRVDQG